MARGNGEGSLYFDSTRNRWRGTVTVGKGQRKSVYGKTKKEAITKMNEIKAQLVDGNYCDLSDITVEEYLSRLIETEYKKNLIKEVTYIRKKAILRKIQTHRIAKMRIQAITAPVIEDFLLSLTDYSNSLIRKEYALLKRCFEDNIPDVIKVNPMAKIKCPRSNQKTIKQRALTKDEQKRLIDVLNSENIKYKEQMLIMLYTGMRMGEINALCPEDVNLAFKTVKVSRTITKDENDVAIVGEETKTEAGRRLIPLSQAAQNVFKDALNNYSPNNNNLLFTVYGKPIATYLVNNQFQHVCKKYGIIDESVTGKVSLHSLRHSFATRCIESGMPATTVQQLLGHTDIRITLNTYTDVFAEQLTADFGKMEEYLNRILS